MSPLDDNNNNTNSSSNNNTRTMSRSEEKYGLRPRTIIKRLQQERTRQEVVPKKRAVRSKSRPAPLSKYRRKTANARERYRMKEINVAFDSLRKVLPDAFEVPTTQSSMTKITTLKHAVDYIRTLSEVLESEDESIDLCSLQNSIQNSIQDSLQDCLDQSFQYSIHQSFQKTVPEGANAITYDQTHPHYVHSFLQEHPQMMDYCSFSATMSASSSPSTNRGSLSSASDLEELLSDDSGLLEDNIDVFHDIPTLCVNDPLDILLGVERDGIFTHELCS